MNEIFHFSTEIPPKRSIDITFILQVIEQFVLPNKNTEA